MALQAVNRNEYDNADGARDNAFEDQTEESFLIKHGILGILGEGLAQLSLWREYFPGFTVSELPTNNEYSQLDRSTLKLLFEAGKAVQNLAYRLPNSTKELSSDWQLFCAVTDRAEYLVGSSDDPDPQSDDEYSSEASDAAVVILSSTKELVDLFSTHIRYLMRLGPTIQDAFIEEAHHQDELPAHRDQSFKLHGPSAYYVSLILDRFKCPDRDLADKLGEANWQRSERVRWTQALDPLHGPVSTSKLTELIGVAPSSVFAPTTTFHDSGLGSSIPASTQYAASFVTTITAQAGNAARVPPTPAEVKHKKPFECWICKTRISHVKNRLQWKMHVFTDLQPYICCVSSCRHLLTFPTRDQWLEHTFHQHHAEDVFGRGLNESHEGRIQCPLCQSTVGATRKEYGKHLGRHLESIALASLPKDVDSENESSSNSASEAESDVLIDEQASHSGFSSSKLNIPLPSEKNDDRKSDGADLVDEGLQELGAAENQTSANDQGPKLHGCPSCIKQYRSKSALGRHQRDVHDTVARRPACNLCGQVFTRQHYLYLHMIRKHGSVYSSATNFICHGPLSSGSSSSWGCGKSFAGAGALRRHFRSNDGHACVEPLLNEAAKQRAAGNGNTIPPIPFVLGLEYPELAALVDQPSALKPSFLEGEGGIEWSEDEKVAPLATHSVTSGLTQNNTDELKTSELMTTIFRPEQITTDEFPLFHGESFKMIQSHYANLWRSGEPLPVESENYEIVERVLKWASSTLISEHKYLQSSKQIKAGDIEGHLKAILSALIEGSDVMSMESGSLRDYNKQLLFLEMMNKDRIVIARRESGREETRKAQCSPLSRQPGPSESAKSSDYQTQLMLLERQHKKTFTMAKRDEDSMDDTEESQGRSRSNEEPSEGLLNTAASVPEKTRSSYWSVKDMKQFDELLNRHGSDWAAIAEELGTKTATMVKNHYHRLFNKTDRSGLQDIDNKADRRRRPRYEDVITETGVLLHREVPPSASEEHVEVDAKVGPSEFQSSTAKKDGEDEQWQPLSQMGRWESKLPPLQDVLQDEETQQDGFPAQHKFEYWKQCNAEQLQRELSKTIPSISDLDAERHSRPKVVIHHPNGLPSVTHKWDWMDEGTMPSEIITAYPGRSPQNTNEEQTSFSYPPDTPTRPRSPLPSEAEGTYAEDSLNRKDVE